MMKLRGLAAVLVGLCALSLQAAPQGQSIDDGDLAIIEIGTGKGSKTAAPTDAPTHAPTDVRPAGSAGNADAAGAAAQESIAVVQRELSDLQAAAKRGDPGALHVLGLEYLRGEGLPRDDAKGLGCLLKAAQKGHLPAQVAVAGLYREGRGTEKNYFEAVQWLRKPVNAGFRQAYLELGVMYFDGKGVYQDFVEAFVLLNLASPTLQAAPPEAFPEARAALAALEKRLTPDQREIAREKAAELSDHVFQAMRQKHPVP